MIDVKMCSCGLCESYKEVLKGRIENKLNCKIELFYDKKFDAYHITVNYEEYKEASKYKKRI